MVIHRVWQVQHVVTKMRISWNRSYSIYTRTILYNMGQWCTNNNNDMFECAAVCLDVECLVCRCHGQASLIVYQSLGNRHEAISMWIEIYIPMMFGFLWTGRPETMVTMGHGTCDSLRSICRKNAFVVAIVYHIPVNGCCNHGSCIKSYCFILLRNSWKNYNCLPWCIFRNTYHR